MAAPDDQVEWFKPTSGGFLGFLGLLSCAVGLVLVVQDGMTGRDWTWVFGLLLVAVLTWSSLLRPRVGLTADALVLRSMVDDVYVPLAAVERFAVRSFTAAQAGGKRHTSAGIGRTMRHMRPQGESIARPFRSLRSLGDEYGGPDPSRQYPDHVEETVLDRMARAREAAGVRPRSAEQAALAAGVRHQLAWPEVAALVVLVIAVLVSVLV